jgi:SAM dependent carboxyl methyltransferase
MEGHGAYNRSSAVQAAGLSPAMHLLDEAASSVPLPEEPEAIVIADYGASEGRNSLGPIATAIARLRERAGIHRAISVVHTDLPNNDFETLFEMLESEPASYLRGDPAAFALAVGRSFYQQLLPSQSVTLG